VNGKAIRLHRVHSPVSGRAVIIPLDHATTIGVAPGLEDLRRVTAIANHYGADAIVVHKGALRVLLRQGDLTLLNNLGLIVHLSASTNLSPSPSRKTLVCSLDEHH